MQYASDLQEFYVSLAPLALIAAGVVLATLLILFIVAAAHNALNND